MGFKGVVCGYTGFWVQGLRELYEFGKGILWGLGLKGIVWV